MHDELGGIENVERALKRAAASEVTHLEGQIPFLGTTASAAPFVGLFGTVWGIMRAFHEIYRMGNANLATVARPISEALIATAVGLFAAIPAVVAYNFFVSRIRVLDSEMTNFSNETTSNPHDHQTQDPIVWAAASRPEMPTLPDGQARLRRVDEPCLLAVRTDRFLRRVYLIAQHVQGVALWNDEISWIEPWISISISTQTT